MKLFGIDFNKYACGGLGNQKLQLMESKTLLFCSESEMLNKVAELKNESTIGEIKPFVTYIVNKESYKFNNTLILYE